MPPQVQILQSGSQHTVAMMLRDLGEILYYSDEGDAALHDWVIDLKTGHAVGADAGCTLAFAARVVDGRVAIDVPDALVNASAEARLVCA